MLKTIANIGVFIVALSHLWFCILEIFFWQKPLGMKIFNLQQEFARQSAPLAANQGIYNAFLSAGLLWGLFSFDSSQAFNVKLFFLSCVVIAGIFAAITVNAKIFIVQAVPALITLALLFF